MFKRLASLAGPLVQPDQIVEFRALDRAAVGARRERLKDSLGHFRAKDFRAVFVVAKIGANFDPVQSDLHRFAVARRLFAAGEGFGVTLFFLGDQLVLQRIARRRLGLVPVQRNTVVDRRNVRLECVDLGVVFSYKDRRLSDDSVGDSECQAGLLAAVFRFAPGADAKLIAPEFREADVT